jgi:sec-independent protein translocase protein TatB
MFDITSSKLLILGIVALLVVGPKELPMLLRTIGKYVGMIRRQAAEFRSQFDEAMRETELAEIRKDVENLGRETEQALREAESTVQQEMHNAEHDVKSVLDTAQVEPPVVHDSLNGLEPVPAIEAPPSTAASVDVVRTLETAVGSNSKGGA